eukprot:659212-Rhodomonas_salina.1
MLSTASERTGIGPQAVWWRIDLTAGSPTQQNPHVSRILLWSFNQATEGTPNDFEVWVTDTTSLTDPGRMCYRHTGRLYTTTAEPLEITCGLTGRYVTLRQSGPIGICEIELYDDRPLKSHSLYYAYEYSLFELPFA